MPINLPAQARRAERRYRDAQVLEEKTAIRHEHLSDAPSYRYLSAVVRTPKGPLTLLSIHSSTQFPIGWHEDRENQRGFIQNLADQVANIQGPLLVVGDFNTTPLSETYTLIRWHLRDAYLDSGRGSGLSCPSTLKLSIRSPSPLVRIDHISHSPDFTGQDAHVLRHSGGSDQRPLVPTLDRLKQ